MYRKHPFSIKKGYKFLWQVLHLLSLRKHRIVSYKKSWKMPQNRTCTLEGSSLKEGFVDWKLIPQTGINPATCEGSLVRLFSSSLRYHIRIICKKCIPVEVYAPRAELGPGFFPIIDVNGFPVSSYQFEIQGLESLLIKASSNDIRIVITAMLPARLFEYIPGKKCITDGLQSTEAYELTYDDYYNTVPTAFMKDMLEYYMKWFLSQEITYVRLTKALLRMEAKIALSFVTDPNRGNKSGSFIFVSSVLGEYATLDDNGIDIGIAIPHNKKAIINIPELHFKYADQFKDDNQWRLNIETGSVHRLLYYNTFELQWNNGSYSIPSITLSGLTNFSMRILNAGSPEGILGVALSPGWSIEFV